MQVMYEASLLKAGLASMAVQSRDGVACILSVLAQYVKHRTICRSCCLVVRRLAELRDIHITAHLIGSNVHGLLAQARSLHSGALFRGICDDALASLGLQPPVDSPVMVMGTNTTTHMPASRWGFNASSFIGVSPTPMMAAPQAVNFGRHAMAAVAPVRELQCLPSCLQYV